MIDRENFDRGVVKHYSQSGFPTDERMQRRAVEHQFALSHLFNFLAEAMTDSHADSPLYRLKNLHFARAAFKVVA